LHVFLHKVMLDSCHPPGNCVGEGATPLPLAAAPRIIPRDVKPLNDLFTLTAGLVNHRFRLAANSSSTAVSVAFEIDFLQNSKLSGLKGPHWRRNWRKTPLIPKR
jgi:hypothetical protein